MTYEQFWNGDPTMTRAYLKAHKLKEERESEKLKWIIWEQGLYNYEALCYVSPIVRAFSKATKPLPYPEKPHGVEKVNVKNEEQDMEIDEKRKEVELVKTQIFFKNWVKNTKKMFAKNKEKEEKEKTTRERRTKK